jgi:hypothetical protein
MCFHTIISTFISTAISLVEFFIQILQKTKIFMSHQFLSHQVNNSSITNFTNTNDITKKVINFISHQLCQKTICVKELASHQTTMTSINSHQ